MKIKDGVLVSIEYTLRDSDGELVDTNVGEESLLFTQGAGHIISGLESALEGREAGDEFEVEIQPEDGYGEEIDELYVEVSLDDLPEEARAVGEQVQSVDEDENPIFATVVEVDEEAETAVLDFNHPMAGQVLNFEIKILEVKKKK